MRDYEFTILEEINGAFRASRALPLELGGVTGPGGGTGGPPGGFIGQLPQTRVTYDTTEAATLYTPPTGLFPPSGASLVDNLNHIRYRLTQVETSSGVLAVTELDAGPYVTPVTQITFPNGTVTDVGGGEVEIAFNTTPLMVREYDEDPEVTPTYTITFSGFVVTDLGGGEALVQNIPISTSGVTVVRDGSVTVSPATIITFVGADVADLGGGEAEVTVTAGAGDELDAIVFAIVL